MDDPRRNFRPEAGKLEQFRVTGESEIRAVVRRLCEEEGPVGLFVDSPSFVTSRVLEVEPDHLDLEVGVDDGWSTGNRGWQRVITADELVCVAFVDNVKIQFKTPVKLISGPGPHRLRLQMPKRLYRMQRREGYRVRPLAIDPVSCLVQMPEALKQIPVLDLSVVGVGLLFTANLDLPTVGATLRDVRLRLPGPRLLLCSLRVRRVVGRPLDDGYHIGCSFEHLPPDSARILQRLVMNIEQARRYSS